MCNVQCVTHYVSHTTQLLSTSRQCRHGTDSGSPSPVTRHPSLAGLGSGGFAAGLRDPSGAKYALDGKVMHSALPSARVE